MSSANVLQGWSGHIQRTPFYWFWTCVN